MGEWKDMTPDPRFLRGLQNQRWTAAGAISELVDNAFGEGRGNASDVSIVWDATNRVLQVLDSGQGMTPDASSLFQLGNTIGRVVGDIGEFGSGGTMALIWLGQKASVWTLRDGKVSSGSVDWDECIRKRTWPQVDTLWYPATATNCPTALLEREHGTLIRLEVPRKRSLNTSHIRRDLARNYGPALRHGRRLSWKSVGRGAVAEESTLHDELLTIPDPLPLSVGLEVGGEILTATGQAGIIRGLTLSKSAIAVCFGPRVLTFTKDCFRSPDGSESFSGIGVTGFIDLQHGWQPFLSTTKTAIDDSRVEAALMSSLYEQLKPILEEVDRENQMLILDDLALELQQMFDGKLKVEVDHGGVLDPDRPGTERVGTKRSGEPAVTMPSEPASRKDDGAVQLALTRLDEKNMEGLLCRIEIRGESHLEGFINEDHEFVQAAIAERPPNRRALHKMVVDAVATAVLTERPQLLTRMFPKPVIEEFESRDVRYRHGFLVRLLIDRVREWDKVDQDVA